MFGYVIPIKCELKMREFDQFQSVYCGLCHALKDHYGISARFLLNYDFTFLAMLLSDETDDCTKEPRRCFVKPFKKKSCYCKGQGLKKAAGFSVILSWYKLQDGVQDGNRAERILYRTLSLFIYRAYRKAKTDFPEFNTHCKEQLKQLAILEQENSGELDFVADRFASLLAFAAEDTDKKRIYHEIFYHTGRLIYLLDAYDDLEKDKKEGNYNPLLMRFPLVDGSLTEEDKQYLQTSMTHSANLVASAYQLLPSGNFSAILENIIYLGMPAVSTAVLNGTFRKNNIRRGIDHKEGT